MVLALYAVKRGSIPKHTAIPPRDLGAHALPTGHYVRRLEGEMGLGLDHPPKPPRTEAERVSRLRRAELRVAEDLSTYPPPPIGSAEIPHLQHPLAARDRYPVEGCEPRPLVLLSLKDGQLVA